MAKESKPEGKALTPTIILGGIVVVLGAAMVAEQHFHFIEHWFSGHSHSIEPDPLANHHGLTRDSDEAASFFNKALKKNGGILTPELIAFHDKYISAPISSELLAKSGFTEGGPDHDSLREAIDRIPKHDAGATTVDQSDETKTVAPETPVPAKDVADPVTTTAPEAAPVLSDIQHNMAEDLGISTDAAKHIRVIDGHNYILGADNKPIAEIKSVDAIHNSWYAHNVPGASDRQFIVATLKGDHHPFDTARELVKMGIITDSTTLSAHNVIYFTDHQWDDFKGGCYENNDLLKIDFSGGWHCGEAVDACTVPPAPVVETHPLPPLPKEVHIQEVPAPVVIPDDVCTIKPSYDFNRGGLITSLFVDHHNPNVPDETINGVAAVDRYFAVHPDEVDAEGMVRGSDGHYYVKNVYEQWVGAQHASQRVYEGGVHRGEHHIERYHDGSGRIIAVYEDGRLVQGVDVRQGGYNMYGNQPMNGGWNDPRMGRPMVRGGIPYQGNNGLLGWILGNIHGNATYDIHSHRWYGGVTFGNGHPGGNYPPIPQPRYIPRHAIPLRPIPHFIPGSAHTY